MFMRIPIYVAGALMCAPLLAPLSASAQAEPLFQCPFPNGKLVTVTAGDAALIYEFGPPHAAPELRLVRDYEDVSVRPWNGVGGSIWEELALSNGDVTYRIWGAFDRMTEAHEKTGGIVVEQDGEELAQLDCTPNGVVYTPFGFFDAYEAAGFCWNLEADRWQEVCE